MTQLLSKVLAYFLMKKFFYFLPAIALLLSACGGTTSTPDDKETDSSKDNSFAQNEFDIIAQTFDGEASNNTTLNGRINGTTSYFCDNATTNVVDNGNGTYTMTIDFGTGCNCLDEKTRAGKLIGTFSGKWNQANSVLTITPQNYTVTAKSGVKYTLSFQKTIEYLGLNTNNHREYKHKTMNAIMTDPTGDKITWNSNQTIEWVEGYGDPNVASYKYLVSGTSSGTAMNGVSFNANITSPLDFRNDCKYRIVAGKLEVTPVGGLARVIDYGSGTCDDKATLTVGSYTTTLIFR